MRPLTAPEAVLRTVLEHRVPLEAETRSLRDAHGSVLAEALVATESLPRFSNSAMDGFAICSADTGGEGCRLSVVGSTMAGDAPARRLGRGEAVRIMTGAQMPDGADAVCRSERCSEHDGEIVIDGAIAPGTDVRHPGEDVRAGQVVFEAGTELHAAHLGVLSALGTRSVVVHRPPVVGVLSSGDELVGEHAPLGEGRIRDANRPALLALVESCGARPVDLGIVGDDEAELLGAIESGVERCDVVVTSGGASRGDRDALAPVLAKLGGSARVNVFDVAIRPARPFVFAEIGPARVPVFGLPGNPVAALVAFELFVRPALRALSGDRSCTQTPVAARAAGDFSRVPDGKVHYVRAVAAPDDDGVIWATPAGGQGSHMLLAMAASNALVVLDDGPGVAPGGTVKLLWLEGSG